MHLSAGNASPARTHCAASVWLVSFGSCVSFQMCPDGQDPVANTFAFGKRASELSHGKREPNDNQKRRKSFAGGFGTANILQRDATAAVARERQGGRWASAVTAALVQCNEEYTHRWNSLFREEN